MGVVRFILMMIFMVSVNGCIAANVQPEGVAGKNIQAETATRKNLPTSYALKGTRTAVVGIAINKDGLPQETIKEIVLLPGERVVFAGPDRFEVVFKNKKAPNRKIKYESQDGVIIVTIPKDIFKKGDFVEEFRKNKYLKFDYSILINGKELDPPMIIRPDH